MSKPTPKYTEAKPKTKRHRREFCVVVDTDDGDTRIVRASRVYRFVNKNPQATLYSGSWVITARSDDLEQLRALCRLVGPEDATSIAHSIDEDDYLYSYWPGSRETNPRLPADART